MVGYDFENVLTGALMNAEIKWLSVISVGKHANKSKTRNLVMYDFAILIILYSYLVKALTSTF